MNIKDFKSGRHITQDGYKSFLPEKVNKEWVVNSAKVSTLLEEATSKVSALNSYSLMIPDADIFIRMHIVKEATTSSKIEGTQTHIEDAVLSKNQVNPEQRNDWQEVQNYIQAMNFAIKELNKLPLSNRLLRDTHRILMQGVRGKHKAPGEFRRSQNWIGGASLKDAVFVPPHNKDVVELMSDLEKFLHNTDINVPHLIRIAIAHYQFETIHPFLDGNGRLGRLLITLYLVSNNILKKPSLYLSDFFERNRQYYYDNLSAVRTRNDLTQWIKFFLVGVIETADKSAAVFEAIIKLKADIEKKKISTLGKRESLAKKTLNYLYMKPVVTVNDIIEKLKISKPTANAIVKDFMRLKILKEQTGFKRNRVFIFNVYLNLFKR
ncbi:MAG: Fic family protein [Crocinitomicaceae bacterium]|nr:Fic family protein [Crocinitomicaceae bacterium]